MPRFRLIGRGTAELAGYGTADAEHRLEKELAAALPTAVLRIVQVRRTEPVPRIVESFAIDYLVTVEVEAEGEDEARAMRAAFSTARSILRGTRFERVEWEKGAVQPPAGEPRDV